MKEIRIYFEGDSALRPGFAKFFEEISNRARARGLRWSLVAGRSTAETTKDFRHCLEQNPDVHALLLVDSEGREPQRSRTAFFMIQCMESWFLADREALRTYFGNEFKEAALPGGANPGNVESIPKDDVVRALDNASRSTKKGKYSRSKSGHGAKLLALLKPERVRKLAPDCDRLFTILEELS